MAADDDSSQTNPQMNRSTNDSSNMNEISVTSSTAPTSRSEEFRAAAEARQNDTALPSSDSSISPMVESARTEGLQGTDGSAAAIAKKLQQVRGYIQQTSTAMEGLEQQADMDKIGQYNTLVKVLKDLKTSEAKLQAHLGCLPGANAFPRENEDSRTQSSVPNSQSLGLVSSITVDRVDSNPAPGSMSERLEAGMEEASQLTNRLRESVARREDLVERYRSTRERLAALKRQRRDIIQQERTVLLSQSQRESPYEDAIPGANYWNLDELNTGLRDFRALYDKVNALRTAYINRNQASAETDSDVPPPDISGQLSQLDGKKSQLIAIIAQLRRLKAAKLQEQGLDPEDEPEEEAIPEEPSIPVDRTSSVNASIAAAIEAASAPVTSTPPVGPSVPVTSVSVPAPSVVSSSPDTTSARGEPQQVNSDITGTTKTGGSVAIGLNEAPVSSVLAARAQMVAAGQELALRTQHLSNLKEELAGMKRLLESTVNKRNAMQAAETGGSSSQPSSSSPPDSSSASDTRSSGQVERAGEFVTGVSGGVIRLTDLERQDPAVIQKYKQLSEAKQRMAQMEEIMRLIQTARGSGRPLAEILSPEQLTLLQQAQAEDEDQAPRKTNPAPSASSDGLSRFAPSAAHSASYQATGLLPEDTPSGSPLPGSALRTHHASVKREDQLSAMQQQLTKTQPLVPPVNEETRYRRPKEQLDKQERWESSGPTEDPRMTEIMTLQEELKQKKNAMEALMRGMGKPSFLHPDNISDNISEDESLPPSPQRRANRRDRSSLDRSLDRSALLLGASALPANNLLTASTERSVRPKQNRASVGPTADNYRSNNLGRTNHTISEALNQLSSMQGNINSLYDTLRYEQEGRGQPSPAPPAAAPQQPKQQLHQQMQNLHQKQQQQLQMQLQQQPFNLFGLPQTPMLPGLPMDMMTIPMLSSSLQQCFSQLYLHSLEIQALNKHMQLLEQRLANEAKMQSFCHNCCTSDKSLLINRFNNPSNLNANHQASSAPGTHRSDYHWPNNRFSQPTRANYNHSPRPVGQDGSSPQPLNNMTIRGRDSGCCSPHSLSLTRNHLRLTEAASMEPSLDSGVAEAIDLQPVNNLACNDINGRRSRRRVGRSSRSTGGGGCSCWDHRSSFPECLHSNKSREPRASKLPGAHSCEQSSFKRCCRLPARRREVVESEFAQDSPMHFPDNNLEPMELFSLHNSNSFGLLQHRTEEEPDSTSNHPTPHLPSRDAEEDPEKFLVDLQSPDPQSLLHELDSEYQRLIAPLRLERNCWNEAKREQLSTDILNNQVPPGMRANNYWDNFRSYTHQNLLSGTSKPNLPSSPSGGNSLHRGAACFRSPDHGPLLSPSPSSTMHHFNAQHMQAACDSKSPHRSFSPPTSLDMNCSQHFNLLLKTQAKTSNANRDPLVSSQSRHPNNSNIKHVNQHPENNRGHVSQAPQSDSSTNCSHPLPDCDIAEPSLLEQIFYDGTTNLSKHSTPPEASGFSKGSSCEKFTLLNFFQEDKISNNTSMGCGEETLLLEECNLECPDEEVRFPRQLPQDLDDEEEIVLALLVNTVENDEEIKNNDPQQ